jgi:type II secretory pathway pseudopilin PulG
MRIGVLIVLAILGVAAALVVAYIRRLQRKSREIDKRLDYSKMKAWKDDDW